MDVVCHQTIGENVERIAPAPLDEPAQVDSTVLLITENMHFAVTSLGYVVGQIGNSDSRLSCHHYFIACVELGNE